MSSYLLNVDTFPSSKRITKENLVFILKNAEYEIEEKHFEKKNYRMEISFLPVFNEDEIKESANTFIEKCKIEQKGNTQTKLANLVCIIPNIVIKHHKKGIWKMSGEIDVNLLDCHDDICVIEIQIDFRQS